MRLGRLFVWLSLCLIAGLVGWWAGSSVLATPEDPLAEPEPVTYIVSEGTVGRSLNFPAVAEWGVVPVANSEATGMVTTVDVVPGETVSDGDVLFTVDLRPVVLARGAVPAFRDVAAGAEGPDVEQLQRLLNGLGFFDAEPDGVFGAGTTAAVRDWQDSMGVDDDGVVRLADVLFVPETPLRISLEEQIKVGNRLTGGEEALAEISDNPVFWIPLASEQRSLVALDAQVKVTYPGGVWEAVTVEVREFTDQQGFSELQLILEGRDGGSVCGNECADWIALEGRTEYPAQVVVVPETTGPLVPVAAITTRPDGATFVTLESGEEVDVVVVAAANGLAVVEGVGVGDMVILPFEPATG